MKGYTVLVVGVILFLGAAFLFALPGAWLLMLLLGALSHTSNYPKLALGFWSCYIIVVILALFGNYARKTS